jgi:hypothetical protein
MAQVAAWQESGDTVLSDLCRRFLARRGLKPIEYHEEEAASVFRLSAVVERVKKDLQAAGLAPAYYFREAELKSKTYDSYHPEKETSEQTAGNAILIEDSDGKVAEISSLPGMERLKAVTDKRERRRFFYVPDEHRDNVRRQLQSA